MRFPEQQFVVELSGDLHWARSVIEYRLKRRGLKWQYLPKPYVRKALGPGHGPLLVIEADRETGLGLLRDLDAWLKRPGPWTVLDIRCEEGPPPPPGPPPLPTDAELLESWLEGSRPK